MCVCTASRELVQNARNNISACKSLLQCKRDELKQLWRENAEQRRVVDIIDRVCVDARVLTDSCLQ